MPIWMPKDVQVFEFDVILYVILRKEDLIIVFNRLKYFCNSEL